MKVKVMLDLDGCIANFYYDFALFLNNKYGCDLDLDNEPEDYPFEKWGHGVDKIDFDTASKEWINQDGFGKIPSYPGAEKFVKELMDKYDVYILTARIGDWDQSFTKDMKNRIKENTYDWLKIRKIPITKLHFIHDKIPFCQTHGISIMVEDKLETALAAAKEGIHTILMNRGYNGSKANRLMVYRTYDFEQALKQIEKLAAI